jgi:hypothetical protein
MWVHGSIPGFEPLIGSHVAGQPLAPLHRATAPGSCHRLGRARGAAVGRRREQPSRARRRLHQSDLAALGAAEVVKKFGEMSSAGVGVPSPRNQCWPGGVPFTFTGGAIQILQQPDKITILYNYDHQVRQLRLNQSHPVHVTPTWYGDSVGHYEDDTLIVDTVGIKVGPFATVDWYGTPHTEALHVIERYRLIDHEAAKDGWERDAKENWRAQPPPNYMGKYLQLRFSVDDEGAKGRRRLRQSCRRSGRERPFLDIGGAM